VAVSRRRLLQRRRGQHDPSAALRLLALAYMALFTCSPWLSAGSTVIERSAWRGGPPPALAAWGANHVPVVARDAAVPHAVAEPASLAIPAIGVHTPLTRLGLAGDHSMQVPSDYAVAGWYAEGPRPGDDGAAVIVGHLDSYEGPAVFFRLHQLEPGDEARVFRKDGSTATFVVERVEQHPKDAFPTQAVYARTPGPTLRLATCGGSFDERTRSYRDNVIVFLRAA
jgi:hypothetical protein